MLSIEPKMVLRDAAVGFLLGLLVMLGVAYGVSTASAQPDHPAAGAR